MRTTPRRVRHVAARLALVMVAALLATGCAARWAYHQGQDEAKRGNWDLAVARLTRAVQRDPDNIGYRIALENARIQASRHHAELARKHLLAENLEAAAEELEIATKYDPANKSAGDDLAIARARIQAREDERRRMADFETLRRRAAARSPIPILSPRSLSPILLRWENQSLQKLFETLGKIAGVNVIFDEGFRDKNVTVNLTGISFQEALDQLTFVNRLFYKVLDQNTIIVVPESTAKRRQYDLLVLRTFYLQNAELKEIEAILKTALGTSARVLSTPALGAITILGTADQMALANSIIERNDKPRGEVLVEVRIMEVNRTKIREYGIGLANYSAALDLAPFDVPQGDNLRLRAHLISSLNLTDFVVTLPSRLLVGFLQSESNTRILASPRLRGAEGKKTTLSIGQEVPVPVTTFTAAQTGGGNTFAPATSFQYRNVGVNLELTPRVSAGGEITLEIAAEFSLLGASATVAGTELPTFSTRKVNGIVRTRDGETILMGGLIQDEEREAFAGAIGLQSIPILNKLLGGPTTKDNSDTEILISLTPYLVRSPKITEDDLAAVAIGTQEIVRLQGAAAPMFGEEEASPAPGPAAGGTPPPPTGPTVGRPAGTVPPGMPAPEDVRTPASAPTPVPPVPTPLPPAMPDVVPTPIPQIVPTPTPAPSPVPASPFAPPPEGASAAPEGAAGTVSGSATMDDRTAASPAGGPRLSATFSPTQGSVGVGETATVGIVVLGAQDLSGVGATLRYDPTLLEVLEVTPGYLLTVDGQSVAAERALESGLVRARFSRASGVAGSGIVASVTFRGLRAGVATVSAETLSLTAGGASRAVAVAPMRMAVE